MSLFGDWKIRLLFWGVYLLTAISLWWHTYQIFLTYDPPFIAASTALAVDGMLALTLYIVGRAYGNQQSVAVAGVIMFALLSAAAQVASRNMANPDVPWVRDVVQYMLPVAGVFTMLVLAFIKYFDKNRDGVPDFAQKKGKPQQHQMPTPRSEIQHTVTNAPIGNSNGHSTPMRAHSLEVEPGPKLVRPSGRPGSSSE